MKERYIWMALGWTAVVALVSILTWQGCTKPKVVREITVDTVRVFETDTVYADKIVPVIKTKLVDRPVPIVEIVPVDSAAVQNRIQAALDSALNDLGLHDAYAEGSEETPEYDFYWRYYFRQQALVKDLTIYRKDTLEIPIDNSSMFDQIKTGALYVLIAEIISAAVYFSLK